MSVRGAKVSTLEAKRAAERFSMFPLLVSLVFHASGSDDLSTITSMHREDAAARKVFHFLQAKKCYRQKNVQAMHADKCALAHYRLAEAAFEEEDTETPSPFLKPIRRIQKRLITSIEISSQ